MYFGEVRREGENGDKADLFDVTDAHQADTVEQSVAEKAKVCTLSYP